MSDCLKENFTITKGLENTFTFTIKQNDTTLPMALTLSDTFVAKLYNLSDDSEVLSKAMTLDSNLLTGVVHLSLTPAETSILVSEKGDKVDRYYIKPTYRLVIICDTTNNGKFNAKVNLVYVI